MMLEAIDLVKAASQRLAYQEPMFEQAAAEPALVRRPSNHSEKIKIQIGKLNLVLPEKIDVKTEDKKEELVLINTGDAEVNEEEPEIPVCGKPLDCGHACKGVKDERKCLPCLNETCAKDNGLFDDVHEDELCTICFT